MAKKPVRTPELLMSASKEATKFWGVAVEDKLPKPTILEDASLMVPSVFLTDILQYARGAESRGEWLFRNNYLIPLLTHYSTTNTVATEWKQDDMGNLYCTVGDGGDTLHVGHIDTVHDDNHSPLQETIIKGNVISLAPIKKNSKAAITTGVRWVDDVDVKYQYVSYSLDKPPMRSLGADDGCAVAMMLYLISQQVIGTYVFTRGEEIGCVGTHYIIENNLLPWAQFKRAIEVDRKGQEEVICNMAIGMTASQSFGTAMAAALGMGHHCNGKGSVTDVAHMSKLIPECINIAAGYDLQHSDRETTDWAYLDRLGVALAQVDWASLPTERAPGQFTKPVTHSAPRTTPRGYLDYDYDMGIYAIGNRTYAGSARNSYGDFTDEPHTVTTSFKELTAGLNEFAKEAVVRKNLGLLLNFVIALDISPAQIDNIICFGNIEGEDDDTLEASTTIIKE